MTVWWAGRQPGDYSYSRYPRRACSFKYRQTAAAANSLKQKECEVVVVVTPTPNPTPLSRSLSYSGPVEGTVLSFF